MEEEKEEEEGNLCCGYLANVYPAGEGCRPQMATAAATLTLMFIVYSVQCIVCSMCKYVDSSLG